MYVVLCLYISVYVVADKKNILQVKILNNHTNLKRHLLSRRMLCKTLQVLQDRCLDLVLKKKKEKEYK